MAEVGAIVYILGVWHSFIFTSAAQKKRRIKIAAKQRADATASVGYANLSTQSSGPGGGVRETEL
jgi:hypothetical protein